MLASELQTYLHDHMPLSQAMQVRVVGVQADRVVLSAPLGPNINHQETVFGGSASALAILSAWSLLHTRLQDAGLHPRLVIQSNTMRYERPMAAAFTASAFLAQPQDWTVFTRMLARKGKARITVCAVLDDGTQPAGQFTGEFVALS